ncbi:MAG TPA: helical backbone metal receptor [Flavisolibacter sp.]|nr:helical backbone metal receptor [Flavisolibacter sp.]
MAVYIDQLNRKVIIKEKPVRIISLVPSQTELLHHLGLEEEVVGITKFCVHPENWFKIKTRIGGTKNIDLQKIRVLNPDLIIANKEENVQQQIEELANDFPVWVSDVNTLDDALKMINCLGELIGKTEQASILIAEIKKGFADLKLPTPNCRLQTAYLIWKEPYMTIGGDTFINDMLCKAGLQNIFQHRQRYPQITLSDLSSMNCELLLLSSEPYPFGQTHIGELKAQLPTTKIILVDGELFSWYGSRLLKAPHYFKSLQQQVASMV